MRQMIQPASANVLNNFAAIPKRSPNALLKCHVTIKTDRGEIKFDGLYESTFDAAIEAQGMACRPCKVTVKVMP